MSSDPTAEQIEVHRKGRQRLIGAVVLALVAVVFVPMLLDPEPRGDRAEPTLAIPSKDAISAPAVTTKAPGPSVQRDFAPADVSATQPVAKPPATEAVQAPLPEARKTVAPRSPEFKPTQPRSPGRQPEPMSAPAAPKLEGFAVQVGAFKDDTKLAQARERIAAARLAHYTERLEGTSGELTRLRAGPFPTREAAERAAAQLKRGGLEARVVTLP